MITSTDPNLEDLDTASFIGTEHTLIFLVAIDAQMKLVLRPVCFFIWPSISVTLIFQVDRGVQSPADISMDISKLVETLKFLPTPFRDGVKLTLESS